jgi:hypothetical protein
MFMMSTEINPEFKKLVKRRDVLRRKLQCHFNLSAHERDYGELDHVVIELEKVRHRLSELRRS